MRSEEKSFREKINTLRKKLVLMKGRWTPRVVIRLTGWLHKKRRLLEETQHGYTSPFMASRQSDFQSYSARLYDVTAKTLRKYHKKKENLELQMKYIDNRIEAYEEQIIQEPVEIKDKRRNGILYRMINSLIENYQKTEQRYGKVVQVIDSSVLETEEMKYAMKSRVESQLYNYLQGAHCFRASCLPELVDDEKSQKLYENYCVKHTIKEVDGYVEESI